jgi:hypothetical protein
MKGKAMSWNSYVPVTPEAQEKTNYCAPAVAQMLLSACSSVAPPPQLVLFAFINKAPQTNEGPPRQFSIGSPDGVALAVNCKAQPQTTRFGNVRTNEAGLSCAQIVCALSQLRSPAAVLVFGGGHWVVVNGADCTGDPLQGPYAIDAFWLYNSDDGHFGGIGGIKPIKPSFALERLAYGAFLDLYFFPVGADDSGVEPYCDGRNFAIVTDVKAADLPTPAPMLPIPFRYAPQHKPSQSSIDALVGQYAPWFDGTQQNPPLPVRFGLKFYSLVPFVSSTSNGTVSNLLCVDMATSYMGGLFGIPGSVTSQDDAISLARAYRLRKPLEGESSDSLDIRHPLRLVWRPCKESLSPFNPFYLVTGNQPHERLYVSLLGGVVSERLHHHVTGAPLDLDM